MASYAAAKLLISSAGAKDFDGTFPADSKPAKKLLSAVKRRLSESASPVGSLPPKPHGQVLRKAR